MRQLHTRDTRRLFCPSWVWVTGRIALPLERNNQLSLRRQGRLHRPFRAIRPMTRNEIGSLSLYFMNQRLFECFIFLLEEEGTAMLSTREVRTLAILREIPFVFSFTDRVKMWQNWILNDKMQQQGESNFLRGPSIQVMIRRNYIYEDAFDKLSLENGKLFQYSGSFFYFNINYLFSIFFRAQSALENASTVNERGRIGRGWCRWWRNFPRISLRASKNQFRSKSWLLPFVARQLTLPKPRCCCTGPGFPQSLLFYRSHAWKGQ